MVSIRLGSPGRRGQEFGINLTFEQARDLARQLTDETAAAEKEFRGLGLAR